MNVTVTVEVALIAVCSLLASALLSVMAVVTQEPAPLDAAQQLIPAATLTATSGALVWVVRQIVSGNLVHRDPAGESKRNRDALEASTKAIAASTKAIERLLDERRDTVRSRDGAD